MKKLIALLLAVLMVFALVACASGDKAPAATDSPATETPAATEDNAPSTDAPAAEAPAATGEALSEEDAEAAREAGTLASDPLTGYEYSDST